MRPVSHILSQLNNMLGEGPFLRRSKTVIAKMVNLCRSVAVQVQYPNLPQIESFLTNFN